MKDFLKNKKMNSGLRLLLGTLIYLAFMLGLIFAAIKIHASTRQANYNFLPDRVRQDEVVEISAKGYIIYDTKQHKVISSANADKLFPLASLSKVISIGAYLDFKQSQGEALTPEAQAVVEKILVESNNEDLESLGRSFEQKFGVSLLDVTRQFVKKVGVADGTMTFNNLTGLDFDEVEASNFGTPLAVAQMYTYVYQNYKDIFEKTKFSSTQASSSGESLTNTNPTADKTFGLVSSKTGYTDLAGGNLSVLVSPAPGSEYLLIVFGSTKSGRFEDVRKLNNILPKLLESTNNTQTESGGK
jgi:D-alanyl-D-alanine carboxypeptidase